MQPTCGPFSELLRTRVVILIKIPKRLKGESSAIFSDFFMIGRVGHKIRGKEDETGCSDLKIVQVCNFYSFTATLLSFSG